MAIPTHKHKCPRCQHVWEHSDLVAFVEDPRVFDLAHTCPRCGLPQVLEKCEDFFETCTLSPIPPTPLASYQARLEQILNLRKAT